jgi:hypothetical protein
MLCAILVSKEHDTARYSLLEADVLLINVKPMIHTAYAVRTLQAVAMAAGLALLLWSSGLPAFFQKVEAASITNASDTLSNSAPNGSSVHTIGFATLNGVSTGQTIVVSFPAGFDLTGLNIDDISLTVGGNATDTEGAAGLGTWGVATGTPTGQDIQFTTPTDDEVASSTAVVLTIGDEVGTMITNPTATTSYEIDIGGTMQDSGTVRVAIVDEVTVTASIDTTLEFSISGVVDGQTVNDSPTTTDATSTATTLPFGALAAGVSKTLAQDLTVTTNAANGFTVTVEHTGDLQSTTGATIDGFIDGAYTSTPTAWVGPSAVVTDPDTYGHWGLTSEDGNLFGSDLWESPSTTPVAVFAHDSVVNASTTRVGYQVEVSSLQEAGDDYSTTLRYIVTPTF